MLPHNLISNSLAVIDVNLADSIKEGRQMGTTWVFTAYNEKPIYAFGTKDLAKEYLKLLNYVREGNLYDESHLYTFEESQLSEDENELRAFNLSDFRDLHLDTLEALKWLNNL